MASVTTSADSVLMNSATISYFVSASLPDTEVYTYSKYTYRGLTYSWTFSPGGSTASNASGTKTITGLTAGAATTITGKVKVTCTCKYYSRTKNEDGSYTDWKYEDSFTYTIKTESDSVTVYTRPGTFTKFSNIEAEKTYISDILTAENVDAWCNHCNKYLSWKNQTTSTAANNCKVKLNDFITAAWYNKCAETCGISIRVSNDHTKNNSLITAKCIKALGTAISS